MFSINTKEGKYQWGQVTKIREGGTPISVTFANAETILDLFKDQSTQYGLDHIINILTTGTGSVEAQARTLVGINYHNAELGNLKNLLKDIHVLTTDQVQAYSGWYMGYDKYTLTRSTDMIIKAIDPNAAGNLGLVNRHKISLCRLAEILHFIFKNNVTRTSYTSFHPNKDTFVYKGEITGRVITCGLTLFKMEMLVMKPHLVIEHRAKERDLEELTLAKAGNDVSAYRTKMQENRNEIDALRKDNVKLDNQRWLPITFEQLVKTGCSDFLEDVKRQRSECIKDSGTFNSGQFYVDMINLYTNYKATGKWDKKNVSSQKSIIALATALTNKQAKKKSNKGNDTGKPKGGGGNNHPKLPSWRVMKSCPNSTCPDKDKWVWCKHHGRKDEHGNQHGMYMPEGHDHINLGRHQGRETGCIQTKNERVQGRKT